MLQRFSRALVSCYNKTMMDRAEFERAVAEALRGLPADLRRQIANVAIVVEEIADDDTLDAAEVDDPMELLGFYHGIPLTERTASYGLVLPDKISLYRQPILAECVDDGQVRAAIYHTLYHEIGHYFGLSDDRLEELGAY